MSAALTNDGDFLRSLTPRQRAYFVRRESARQARLQSTLRDLSRGLGTVSELNGEAQAMLLTELLPPLSNNHAHRNSRVDRRAPRARKHG